MSTNTNFVNSGLYVVTLNSGTTTVAASYKAATGGTATFAASSVTVLLY
jgi:hypothetical protein